MKRFLLAAAILCAASTAWSLDDGSGFGDGGLPAGTPVLTHRGAVDIEDLKPGYPVLAWTGETLVKAKIERLIKTRSRILRLKTSHGSLKAAYSHPLLTRYGYIEARELRKGERVAVLRNGRRVWAKIKSIKPAGTAEVFNLSVSPPHTFIAGGFIVHNRYHGRYGRRTSALDYIVFVFFGAGFLLIKGVSWFQSRRPTSLKAHSLSGNTAEHKSSETRDILDALSVSEKDFSPALLEDLARSTFTAVQAAWQSRDHSPVKGLMMPHLFAAHNAKAESMKARGEINRLEDLRVHNIVFVHVRCPEGEDGRSFTALVSASARDYTLDERNGALVRGSRKERPFQEFWTFYRNEGRWALARIDQIGEMDFLNAPNLPAGRRTAQEFAAKRGPASAGGAVALAAAASAAAAYRGGRPGKGDPAADRQKMEIAATLAFENIYSAWGANDPAGLSSDHVSGEALARLRKIMEARKAEGISFRFDRLAPRRAEIVLVTPAAKSPLRLDEFTARINATAVRTMSRNGKPLHSDEAPAPFTEYWVFGRQNDSWKLRDILPRMDQSGEDRTKDGAPNPSQIEWYWIC